MEFEKGFKKHHNRSAYSHTFSHHLFTKFSIKVLKFLFKTFFGKRIKIAINNYLLSNVGNPHDEIEAKKVISHSLDHLSLTLIGCIKRIIYPQRSNNLSFETGSIETYFEKIGIKLETEHDLEKLLSEKRGIIFVSAHLGAWEELILIGQILNRPLHIISKRMKLSWAQYLWDRSRSQSPQRLDRGERAKYLVKALKGGAAVADVLDQHDPKSNAFSCLFLGRPAYTSPDLARIAVLSEAIIIPIFLIRMPQGSYQYKLKLCSAIDPLNIQQPSLSNKDVLYQITQCCCDQISKIIRLYPEQWMWIHRRWKEKKNQNY